MNERKPLIEILIPKDKSLEMAERFQRKARELGSDSRIVRGDNGYINWEGVFSQSLLGLRRETPYEINLGDFARDKEIKLLGRLQKGDKEVKILVVSDFDGVLVSPAHDWKRSGRIDLISWLGFKEMKQAADNVLIRTSRWFLSGEARAPFKDKLSRFPFFDAPSLRQLQKGFLDQLVAEHKPLFREDKNFGGAVKLLVDNLDLAEKVMVYFFISSEKDRNEAIAMLKKYPSLASSIVFFDTGHFCL